MEMKDQEAKLSDKSEGQRTNRESRIETLCQHSNVSIVPAIYASSSIEIKEKKVVIEYIYKVWGARGAKKKNTYERQGMVA